MTRDLSSLLAQLPFKFEFPEDKSLVIQLPNLKEDQIRKSFQLMDKVQKETYLKRLNKQQLRWMYAHPDIFLFDKQIILGQDWMYYLLRCGRGFGKTHAGAAWIAKQIRQGAQTIGLMG